MGERRLKPRFEIVGGDLWGRFDAVATLTLRDVGVHGVLVHSSMALAAGSMHVVTIQADGLPDQNLHVRVAHCRPAADEAGSFAVGLEFIGLVPELRALFDELLNAGGAETL